MKFTEICLAGTYIIDLELHRDDRGFFARSWCQREFTAYGLNTRLVQCNISFNAKKGTLRGMHYQIEPYAECKLVRCTAGSIYDVVIDLRPGSATFKQWVAVELSATNRRMLYVPAGLAHGFQTLEDKTEVAYQISEFYIPETGKGIRWNDPAFGIRWPATECRTISNRDKSYPDFTP